MDKFIRQLTHDDTTFQGQWPNIVDKLHELINNCEQKNTNILVVKIKTLDAIVVYILAESITSQTPVYAKIALIKLILEFIINDPLPSLTDIVRHFRRILDVNNIFNEWYLSCIEAFHYECQLFQRLLSTKSIDSIESIFQSLQKHPFLNDQTNKDIEEKWQQYLSRRLFSPLSMDTNVLNCEEIMFAMRSTFQQFFRSIARMSHQSRIWSAVVETLTRTLPTIFDSYTKPTDAQIYLKACIEPPISSDLIYLIVKSYNRNVNLLKENLNLVLIVIEKLLLLNHLKEARQFVVQVILEHFDIFVNMETLIQMFIRVCPLVNVDYRNDFCQEILSSVTYKLGNVKCNKSLAPLYFDLVLNILNLCVIKAPKCAQSLLEKQEFYPWKELAPRFNDLVRSCIAYEQIDIKSYWSDLDSLSSILRLVVDRAKINMVIFRATHEPALQVVLRWSHNTKIWSTHVYRMAEVMLDLIDQQKITADICNQFLKVLHQKIIDNQEVDYEENICQLLRSFFTNLATHLAKYIELLKILPHEVHRELASFILATLACPIQYENGQTSFEHIAATQLWYRIGQCLTNEVDARLYKLCIKKLYSLACDDNEQTFYDWWSLFWNMIGMKLPNVAADYVEDFLSDTIDRKHISVASLLPMLYNKHPEPYHARLNDLINVIFDGDVSYISLLGHVFLVIVKEHPELITANQLDRLFTSIKDRTDAGYEMYSIFQGLGLVANAKPNLFHNYRSILLRFIVEQHNLSAFNCLQQYFVASTIINSEEIANEYLTILINLLKTDRGITNDIRIQIFHTCQLIGMINKKILQTKRKDLIEFQSYTECRTLIDFIDGNKMSEENQVIINQTRNELGQIEKRVVKTEKDVHNVKTIVKRQELNVRIVFILNIPEQITNLDVRVNVVDTQLSNVTEQVQVHTREIERIDAKTLSYVPSEWGHQVCQLLNVKADNDWRLLGKRFGYSASELRHWSMQTDPSMTLLNEWFMTHKTDEATYGLVKMLEEIDRQDVAKIIREAVIAAGELIPDDMSIEIKRLPPVFLSYQWGVQKAVTNLKNHLEAAGYSCWMDTGQMGGGDKLFAKIDAGIRGAKVIICCMNTAYAQSDNCLREVHLCVSTGKPLIPLQMEKQTWPPEGALGPIMSEYLYIRFYDRKSNTDNYWPTDKFTELLGQIRYHVAPDPDMINEQYYNWFVPQINNLIFLQPTSIDENDKKIILKDDIPMAITHPQIMISYQWDRQADIVGLYQRLTRLNYHCWLDIFQMGGGDSLFEKIDAGIRNAKCVLACISPKYTKSINCRREMSLADALTKPIVPLLLEETNVWPPPGPMSLVFTDKIYIDFRRSNINVQGGDIWTNQEFDKVLRRLKEVIPEIEIDAMQKSLSDIKSSTMPVTTLIENDKKSEHIQNVPKIQQQSRSCCII
ncbi:unnamed protein product [Rotaria sordida]|uniref:Death domain-containing protein n=1 Tax=Rotaria sordida TaxID=392033 RepID=A0A819E4D3_9BILA|nr:unnamed protein product [Rotaria sordida]